MRDSIATITQGIAVISKGSRVEFEQLPDGVWRCAATVIRFRKRRECVRVVGEAFGRTGYEAASDLLGKLWGET